MDLETCLKGQNSIVIQLNNNKLGQMTNLNVIFYMLVSIGDFHHGVILLQLPESFRFLFYHVN